MQFIQKATVLDQAIQTVRKAQRLIVYVPTMGALHEGHLQLIDAAKATGNFVVCSIFVNPTQFDNAKDLEKYPRMHDHDAKLLAARGCDLVFCPDAPSEVYPNGVASLHFNLGPIADSMEGAYRPGHFQGVATVLSYFFGLIRPNEVIMGEKDFQQLLVVRRLVQLLDSSIQVTGLPTVREVDGLAMSSRNTRLSPEMRQESLRIYRALSFARAHWSEHLPNVLTKKLMTYFEGHPEIEIDYLVIADEDTLQPIENWETTHSARCFIACRFSDVRLIDNMPLF
jgi:pantoate--beta-alanine ligase